MATTTPQVLTDAELLAKLANMFRDLGGLAAECEARGWQREQQILSSAGLGVAVALQAVEERMAPLKPWEFLKDGTVHVCSWCEAELGRQPDKTKTHGVCSRHRTAFLKPIADRYRHAGKPVPFQEVAA